METLQWLIDRMPEAAALKDHRGIRLHHVDLMFRDEIIVQQDTQVGEVVFP